MFFIQYAKGRFVNAETIEWLSVENETVIFATTTDSGAEFKVDNDFTYGFLNHIQALNENIDNVFSKYTEMNSK